ncbi:MAG: PD40 domain-containing protein [Acidobacteria bacterium]|nr:PD40 domain-containing protein [Acidobacteriota bacterium]
MSLPQPISPKPTGAAGNQLLETWKEIAVYLNRDMRTVKRWEQSRGLPVHRLPGGPQAAVYAVKSELDAWRRGDSAAVEKTNGVEVAGKWTLARWIALAAIVLAISGICLWLLWPVKPKPIPRVTSLTTFPGVEWFPAFSPGGKSIAFSWSGEQENNYDIYVMLLNGGKPLRLTSDAAMDLAPAWSPDGTRIAFLRWRLGESRTERVIIPALGGPERKTDEGSIRPSATGIFFPLMAWTPDGSRLIGGGASSTGAYALRLISTETGETVKWLTDPPPDSPGDCCPTVSPDGQTLAFLRATPARSYKPMLLSISRNGEPSGGLLPLEIPSCWNPLWSGDSSELFCVVADGEERTLWRIPVRGNRPPHALPSIGALGQHLTISARGDRLVYSNFSWEGDIWQLALSGGTPAPVRLISSTADDLRPQYSPDGKKIAFLSSRSGHLAVWVSEQDGSNASLLAAATEPHAPSWSPDGRQIVYTCRVGAHTEDVCIIGSGGGTPRQLTKDPARDMLPSWSRDGRWIYFASDRSGTFQTWKIPADGSAPTVQVTRNGGFGGIESADGRFLFYGRAILSSPIYRMPVQGGDEVLVGDGVRSLRLPLNFAVDKDGIVFASSDDMTRRFELRRYLLASGKTELIARIGRGLGNGISLSPDGRSLLFTTMELRSGDLFMVENFR